MKNLQHSHCRIDNFDEHQVLTRICISDEGEGYALQMAYFHEGLGIEMTISNEEMDEEDAVERLNDTPTLLEVFRQTQLGINGLGLEDGDE